MKKLLEHKLVRQGLMIVCCILLLFVLRFIPSGNKTETPVGTAKTSEETVLETTESSESINDTKHSEETTDLDVLVIELNDNMPLFSDEEKELTDSFEKYSDLDSLGRTQTAFANISSDIMPTEDRSEYINVTPSGWKQANYGQIIDEYGYLYNRCHLIAYSLAGEGDNEKNIITGTRYFNVNGMLPFEEKVADYLYKNPKNHVLYRVAPVYVEDNLVASYVTIEAYSVEDKGDGICFYVRINNIQPNVAIDYKTGNSYVY